MNSVRQRRAVRESHPTEAENKQKVRRVQVLQRSSASGRDGQCPGVLQVLLEGHGVCTGQGRGLLSLSWRHCLQGPEPGQ